MSWGIVRSRVARGELDALWLRVAEDDPDAADRMIDEIDGAIARLRDYPRLGRPRDDIHRGLRGLVARNTLILYQVNSTQHRVEIIRIVDGRRDLSALFSA